MRRSIPLLLLILLMGLTLSRSERPRRERELSIEYVPLPVSKSADPAYHLGSFRLEGAWQMASRSRYVGSYSALLAMPGGSLLAFSDSGAYLRFTPPGAPKTVLKADRVLKGRSYKKSDRDIESAAFDPGTGRIWLGMERTNSVIRLTPDLKVVREVRPSATAGWGANSGPEAMTRLNDGRFVLLREAFNGWFDNRRHDAVVFDADPTAGARSQRFVFEGPAGFEPTDMTQLPDGRVLILLRRLLWPMPQRFAGRLAIADPGEIRPGKVWKAREVARIASSLPVDNFEGLAVVPADHGRLTVWLISDDNLSNFQRTILWKLSVDPRQLP